MRSQRLMAAFTYIDHKYLRLVETEKSEKKHILTYGTVVAACTIIYNFM